VSVPAGKSGMLIVKSNQVWELAMAVPNRRNSLLPWWIGLVIIIAAVAFAAYKFSCSDCGPPSVFLLVLILGIMPAVYLTLMYITLKIQGDRERE